MDELDREHPYYEGALPVRVTRALGVTLSPSPMPGPTAHTSPLPTSAHAQADSKSSSLTIRILNGSQVKSSGSRCRLLHVEIADATDSFFLYSFTVSESEYAEMASEQTLLVDFATFPSHLVSLLDACTPGRDASASSSLTTGSNARFTAVLTLKDTGSHFAVVETNAFKQLTYISLAVKAANDAGLKRYLAARLLHTQQQLAGTSEQLARLHAEASRLKEANDAGCSELSRLRGEYESRENGLKLTHARELADVREKSAAAVVESEERHRAASGESYARTEATIVELRSKLDAANGTIGELLGAKSSLESALREAKSALAGASSDASTGQSEVGRLRATLSESESVRLSQARELTSALTRVAVLEQSLSDRGDVLDRTQSLLAAAEAAKATVEEGLQLYKSSCSKQQQKLEACVAEINRGNGIISKLQEEYKLARTKAKAKGEAVRTLEVTLSDRAAAIDTLQRELHAAHGDVERERSARESCESTVGSLKAQLMEARDAIAQNQQVISWLNKELNETQTLTHSRPLGASNPYAFSTPLTTTQHYGHSASPSTSPPASATTLPLSAAHSLPPSSIPRPRTSTTTATPHGRPSLAMSMTLPGTSTGSGMSGTGSGSGAGEVTPPPPASSSTSTAAYTSTYTGVLFTPPKPSSSSSLLLAKDSNPYLQPLMPRMVSGGSPATALTKTMSSVKPGHTLPHSGLSGMPREAPVA